MRSITIDGQKYFFLKLKWVDIVGTSTLEGNTEFDKLKCATIITEGYLLTSLKRVIESMFVPLHPTH